MKHHFLTALGRVVSVNFLILFFAFQASSQTIGRMQVDQFPSDPWGGSVYGLTWLPTDYASNPTATYPVIIFLHGSGEAGSGTSGLYNLLRNALPQKIANGWNPEAVNPITGQNQKFIVVCPQTPVWSANFQQLSSIVPSIFSKYRVDRSRVYVTGLSAGGAGTWATVCNGATFAQNITAVVPVAAAGTNTPAEAEQLPLVGGTYGVKVWSICGSGDSFINSARSFTSIINGASPAPSVPAVLTELPGGHDWSVWNTAYDPNWRSNAQNQNIFEWFLRYQRGSTGAAPLPTNPTPVATFKSIPARVEAEEYVAMSGVQKETTADAGGGQNVGWIDNGDWMDYNVSTSAASSFTVSFRVATQMSGAQLQIRNAGGAALATVAIPNTGGWQTWQTVTATIQLPSGNQTLRVVSTASAAWNINWIDFAAQAAAPLPVSYQALPGKVEAEAYSAMSGIQKENTADAGGGENVGYIDQNDWMDYNVNPSTAGTYTVAVRVASQMTGGQLQVRNASGTVLATVNLPNTGGWQTWQTVTASLTLPSGNQTLRVVSSSAASWNINWIEYTQGSSEPAPAPVPAPSTTIRIESEHFTAMSGVQTEGTTDVGGGQNVGWIDQNDWMDYSVRISTAGTYNLSLRVASQMTGGQAQIRNAAGTVLATVNIPNTGGWQTWQTVTASVTLPVGTQTLRVVSTASASWNINWKELALGSTTPSSSPIRIEAENFTTMSGVQTEGTGDAGGGQNVGWIDNGDWMDYSVNVPATGAYTVSFRVASQMSGAQLQLRASNGSILATVNVPNTGGWQSWQTVTASVSLSAGAQTLRIHSSSSASWNINWWELASGGASVRTAELAAETVQTTAETASLSLYPNPVTDRVVVSLTNPYQGALRVEVLSLQGVVVKSFSLQKTAEGTQQFYLSVGELTTGTYILRTMMSQDTKSTQLIKQ
jgi:dienelactone hydrolase